MVKSSTSVEKSSNSNDVTVDERARERPGVKSCGTSPDRSRHRARYGRASKSSKEATSASALTIIRWA
jgi:hypothetical protein